MSNKNYHNYSKPFKTPDIRETDAIVVNTDEPEVDATVTDPEVAATVADPEVDATVADPELFVEPEIATEVKPELPTTAAGVVSGCKKLNVRNRPNITAGIVTTIDEGTEVEIAQPIVNGDFYKVTLANGVVGYCMKKFIVLE